MATLISGTILESGNTLELTWSHATSYNGDNGLQATVYATPVWGWADQREINTIGYPISGDGTTTHWYQLGYGKVINKGEGTYTPVTVSIPADFVAAGNDASSGTRLVNNSQMQCLPSIRPVTLTNQLVSGVFDVEVDSLHPLGVPTPITISVSGVTRDGVSGGYQVQNISVRSSSSLDDYPIYKASFSGQDFADGTLYISATAKAPENMGTRTVTWEQINVSSAASGIQHTTYYVKPRSGSDLIGNGSAGNPYETIGKCLTEAQLADDEIVTIYINETGRFDPTVNVPTVTYSPTLPDGGSGHVYIIGSGNAVSTGNTEILIDASTASAARLKIGVDSEQQTWNNLAYDLVVSGLIGGADHVSQIYKQRFKDMWIHMRNNNLQPLGTSTANWVATNNGGAQFEGCCIGPAQRGATWASMFRNCTVESFSDSFPVFGLDPNSGRTGGGLVNCKTIRGIGERICDIYYAGSASGATIEKIGNHPVDGVRQLVLSEDGADYVINLGDYATYRLLFAHINTLPGWEVIPKELFNTTPSMLDDDPYFFAFGPYDAKVSSGNALQLYAVGGDHPDLIQWFGDDGSPPVHMENVLVNGIEEMWFDPSDRIGCSTTHQMLYYDGTPDSSADTIHVANIYSPTVYEGYNNNSYQDQDQVNNFMYAFVSAPKQAFNIGGGNTFKTNLNSYKPFTNAYFLHSHYAFCTQDLENNNLNTDLDIFPATITNCHWDAPPSYRSAVRVITGFVSETIGLSESIFPTYTTGDFDLDPSGTDLYQRGQADPNISDTSGMMRPTGFSLGAVESPLSPVAELTMPVIELDVPQVYGETYYVLITNGSPTSSGNYSINIYSSGEYDFVANSGDWSNASGIDIYAPTITFDGKLEGPNDSDLYSFPNSGLIGTGVVVVSGFGEFYPSVYIYNSSQELLTSGDTTTTVASGAADLSAHGKYYICVDSAASGTNDDRYGDYSVSININATIDDYADSGNWGAGEISLSNGSGVVTGFMETWDDTDTFAIQFPFDGTGTIELSGVSRSDSYRLKMKKGSLETVNFDGSPVVSGVVSTSITGYSGDYYYPLVDSVFGSTSGSAAALGQYTLGVYLEETPAEYVDDYPDYGDWTTAASMTPTVTGFAVTGEIYPGGDTDLFTFNIGSGFWGSGVVTAIRVSGVFTPSITLYDNTTNDLWTATGIISGDTAQKGTIFHNDHDYYLMVKHSVVVTTGQISAQNTGVYTLEVSYRASGDDDHAGTDNLYGGTVLSLPTGVDTSTGVENGILNTVTDWDVVRFVARGNDDQASMTVSTGTSISTLQPSIQIYNEYQDLIYLNNNISGDYGYAITTGLTAGLGYFVGVGRTDKHGFYRDGPWQLDISHSGDAGHTASSGETGSAPHTVSINAALAFSGDTALYKYQNSGFTNTASVYINALDTGNNSFLPRLTVYDFGFNVIADITGGQELSSGIRMVDQADYYYLVHTDPNASGYQQTGPYEVGIDKPVQLDDHADWNPVPWPPTATTIMLDSGGVGTVTGTIGTIGDTDTFKFYAGSGNMLISIEKTDNMIPSIAVYDELGNSISNINNETENMASGTVGSTSQQFVYAYAYVDSDVADSGRCGTYKVTIEAVPSTGNTSFGSRGLRGLFRL